jgi:hypothetical protein
MSYILHKETRPHPTNHLLQIEFSALEEYANPVDRYETIELARNVQRELNRGNQAAWFSARIVVRLLGTDIESKPEYLGCCSYRSYDEFMQTEYFNEMVDEATKQFSETIVSRIQSAESTVKMLKEYRSKL